MNPIDWTDLTIGLIVPIIAVALTIMWKALARAGRPSAPDEWLVVFELLLRAMALAVSEAFGPEEVRITAAGTITNRADTALIAVMAIFVVATIVAFAINTAMRQPSYQMSHRVIFATDGIGLAAFAGTYLALHL